jgi:hypothetical protein
MKSILGTQRLILSIFVALLCGCGGGGSQGAPRAENIKENLVISPSSSSNLISLWNGAPRECEILQSPAHGQMEVIDTCSYYYNPDQSYTGPDQVVVRLREFDIENTDKIREEKIYHYQLKVYFYSASFIDVIEDNALKHTKFILTGSDGYIPFDPVPAALGIGDFNGDGADDFAIQRNPDYTSPLDVAVVYGQAGLPALVTLSESNTPFVNPYGFAFRWLPSEEYSDQSFRSLRALGKADDFNNDGYNDLLLSGNGTVMVFGGQELADVQTQILAGNSAVGLAQKAFGSDFHDQVVGSTSVGDVNGDLIPDFNIATGRSLIIIPGKQDPSELPTSDDIADYYRFYPSTDYFSSFWASHLQNSSGDVNGDGFSDVINSDFVFDRGVTAKGKAVLFYGGTNLPKNNEVNLESDQIPQATTITWGGEEEVGFGEYSTVIPDINGDGYDDIAVGCENYTYLGEEFVVIVYGGPNLGQHVSADTARHLRIEGQFIKRVTTLGDINGDGFNDIAVYRSYSDRAHNDFYIIYGAADLPEKIVLPEKIFNGKDKISNHVSWFRYDRFKSISPAGDVNVDGYDDFLVTTYAEGNPVYLVYGGEMFKQPRLPEFE